MIYNYNIEDLTDTKIKFRINYIMIIIFRKTLIFVLALLFISSVYVFAEEKNTKVYVSISSCTSFAKTCDVNIDVRSETKIEKTFVGLANTEESTSELDCSTYPFYKEDDGRHFKINNLKTYPSEKRTAMRTEITYESASDLLCVKVTDEDGDDFFSKPRKFMVGKSGVSDIIGSQVSSYHVSSGLGEVDLSLTDVECSKKDRSCSVFFEVASEYSFENSGVLAYLEQSGVCSRKEGKYLTTPSTDFEAGAKYIKGRFDIEELIYGGFQGDVLCVRAENNYGIFTVETSPRLYIDKKINKQYLNDDDDDFRAPTVEDAEPIKEVERKDRIDIIQKSTKEEEPLIEQYKKELLELLELLDQLYGGN